MHAPEPRRWITVLAIAMGLSTPALHVSAQAAPPGVLVRSWDRGPHGALQVDRGASGAWQKLMQAGTTASVLYTAGHPDDEEAGVLTLLARGMGVRTALLTLNRGEGGANAIGPELFDALGLIRTEELRLAGRYYGLADQYFTTAVDYGYSKTLSEAMRSWDRNAVLGDMVRVIRTNRPLVVVSRWHGSERDGHGHHQAAGVLTPEAVEAAADPLRFPEQIDAEGLRPWRVPKLYRGRLAEGEAHNVEVDAHVPSPWLGDSYQGFGAYGLSLQRSQTAGRVRAPRGPATPARYQRLRPTREGDALESDLFDGLDTTLPGVGTLTGAQLPPGAVELLSRAQDEIEAAVAAFDFRRPSASAPALARALTALREARPLVTDPDTDFLLAVEERQIADALLASAGVDLSAQAVPQGAPPGTTMAAAISGSHLDVHVAGTASTLDAELISVSLQSPRWSDSGEVEVGSPLRQGVAVTLPLTIPDAVRHDSPWYYRPDIRSNHYLVRDSAALRRGGSPPTVAAVASMRIAGVLVDATVPVERMEDDAPFGTLLRPLDIVPPLSLRLSPGVVVRRPGQDRFTVTVEVTSQATEPADAVVEVEPPEGWTASPPERTLRLGGADRSATVSFELSAPRGGFAAEATAPDAAMSVARASVRAGGRVWTEGFQLIEHRDLRPRRLYRPAELTITEVDVTLPEGLQVGYVMGAGDDVPAAIEQLGADVTLLEPEDLIRGDLSRYATLVIGTRAYAVRPDLVENNARVVDYAESGGNLVVLYQTPEYDPARQAPLTASLPGSAEEVSEEDAPVRILAPDHPLLTTPNRIGPRDFDGWIEQRGSKFFESWSDAYTALVESHDEGQAPQRGIWLSAPVGEGRFTYVALALQRQLPYGVPGAYRILANLLTPVR